MDSERFPIFVKPFMGLMPLSLELNFSRTIKNSNTVVLAVIRNAILAGKNVNNASF